MWWLLMSAGGIMVLGLTVDLFLMEAHTPRLLKQFKLNTFFLILSFVGGVLAVWKADGLEAENAQLRAQVVTQCPEQP